MGSTLKPLWEQYSLLKHPAEWEARVSSAVKNAIPVKSNPFKVTGRGGSSASLLSVQLSPMRPSGNRAAR
jgi:hypothetical protein